MPMKIEHAAWTVSDPMAAADWYVAHLGMRILRSHGAPAHARFLADSTGRVLLEIYNNPKVKCPDYRNVDPLLIHLAFTVADIKAERDRLIAAGAAICDDVTRLDSGDEICMLRDPWGFPIQLVKRAKPI